jgi:hypothetical protein
LYREPHLQKKSDECADLWRVWFSLFRTRNPDDPERKKARQEWIKSCKELGEMISQEVKTNDRYKHTSLE